MFTEELTRVAEALLVDLRQRGLKLATAESCTGGLIAGLMTEIAGSSDVVDRGFVTYSNDAKIAMLGVRTDVLGKRGAVSREVAVAMAEGALVHSMADITIAVTGVAGPGGGTVAKPIGLVHLAAARIGGDTLHRECRFGALSRAEIRLATVVEALGLVRKALELSPDQRPE